jgi:galactose oxidase
MNWIDTTGDGSITAAGNRADDPYSINGVAVMYQPGKIFKTGGQPSYSDADATTNTYIIDITAGLANPAAPVTVRKLPPMAYPRAFANGVALPGGKVLVIGGETHGITFNDDTSVMVPELWDPATEQFTLLAPMDTPRNYHSVALLLPDGRVFSGGGGLCGEGCVANHQDGSVFSPPYLFQPDGVTPASRPAFNLVHSSIKATQLSNPLGPSLSIPLGATLTAKSSGPVKSFELIRLSATTHAINTDQRRVPLTIVAAAGNSYSFSMPSDPGIVVPGYWMLFAMDAKGTPSVAKIILIK